MPPDQKTEPLLLREIVMELIQRRLIALMMMFMVGMASLPAAADEMLDDQINQRPGAGAMALDALIARPLLLALTTAGVGLFVVTLPFSALGGTMAETAKTLVSGPAHSTFLRCLGCTKTQDEWKNKQVATSVTNN
jgi:hypothetical protein